MNKRSSLRAAAWLALVGGLCVGTAAQAELSAEELAKLAQNPVGNLVSVPFQNNANYNVGPLNGNQNVLNIQPVIPVSINADWNIITRTILPVISMPALSPAPSAPMASATCNSPPSCRQPCRTTGSGVSARWRNCRPTPTGWATRTGGSGRPLCCCTWKRATPGSMAG